MNGIVTGKQEKQAGSLVWKSIFTAIGTYTADLKMSVNENKYLYAPYYLRVIDGQNNISYIDTNNIGTNYSDTYNLKFQVFHISDNTRWAEVAIYKNRDIYNFYLHLTGSYYVSNYIKEMSLGTLE